MFNICDSENYLNNSNESHPTANQCVVRMWDAKSSVRLLAASGLGCVTGPVEDPRVAAWMLDPGAKEPNICNLVTYVHFSFCKHELMFIE